MIIKGKGTERAIDLYKDEREGRTGQRNGDDDEQVGKVKMR